MLSRRKTISKLARASSTLESINKRRSPSMPFALKYPNAKPTTQAIPVKQMGETNPTQTGHRPRQKTRYPGAPTTNSVQLQRSTVRKKLHITCAPGTNCNTCKQKVQKNVPPAGTIATYQAHLNEANTKKTNANRLGKDMQIYRTTYVLVQFQRSKKKTQRQS